MGWNDVHQPKVQPVGSGGTPSRASGRQWVGWCLPGGVGSVCDCLFCSAPPAWQLLAGRAVPSALSALPPGSPGTAEQSWVLLPVLGASPGCCGACNDLGHGTTGPGHRADRDASSSGEGVALSELPDAEGSGHGHDHCASLQEPAAAALPSPVSCPLPSQTAPGEAGARAISGPRGTTAPPPPGRDDSQSHLSAGACSSGCPSRGGEGVSSAPSPRQAFHSGAQATWRRDPGQKCHRSALWAWCC